MLRIENLTFAYPKHRVMTDMSLEFPKGKIYGLLGPNGAGKSTLLYLISGLLTPKAGRVLFDGEDTRRRLPSTLEEIFILPEEFELPAVKLDRYVRSMAKFYPHFSMEDLRRHLEVFDMPYDANLGALSMGQKKKIFMCIALACNTRLLLMDEPTNGLDIPAKSRFRKFVVSSMTDDRTIIISTHQVRDIDKILDHVVITGKDGIVLDCDTYDVTRRLKFLVAPMAPSGALYAQPTLGGYNVVLANTDGADTEINLESLFEFAQSRPEEIGRIFNVKD
ncbi:MAG: ATP-binding cassette domain-containing protein [Muribaculaceae bacterium]|nr:ATP-binding cassette domain-containing protein [Muribaculaceae bacterium]